MSAFVVGLLTGVLSGCGIGGGSLLLLWLTLVQDMPHFTAGGINLLYFLACAPAALVSHLKNHLIDRGAVKFCVPFGAMTSLLASFAAAGTDTSLLRRLFGVLLLYIGAKELFTKRKNPGTDPKPSSSNRVTRKPWRLSAAQPVKRGVCYEKNDCFPCFSLCCSRFPPAAAQAPAMLRLPRRRPEICPWIRTAGRRAPIPPTAALRIFPPCVRTPSSSCAPI